MIIKLIIIEDYYLYNTEFHLKYKTLKSILSRAHYGKKKPNSKFN